jgi:LysR family hydrogen peroxide-inducible transcriptional activator
MGLLSLRSFSLRQLQYLVAVADLGGFRRAAEACHVAQPSLSAQVAAVEGALAVQIFERGGRSVRVSSAGAAIVEQARRVLVAAGELSDLARQLTDPFSGTFRVGVIPTVCPYLLPDLTPALGRAFPHLTVQWSEDRTAGLVRQIEEGALDAAILARESDTGSLESTVIGRDPFVIAAAPGHALVRSSRPASPSVLDGAQLLLLEDGHCLRDQAIGLCARVGAKEADFRATSLSTLVQMVGASAGATLLPSLALAVENRRGQLRIRPFRRLGPGRTLVLAWRRGSAMRAPLEQIAAVVRQAVSARDGLDEQPAGAGKSSGSDRVSAARPKTGSEIRKPGRAPRPADARA